MVFKKHHYGGYGIMIIIVNSVTNREGKITIIGRVELQMREKETMILLNINVGDVLFLNVTILPVSVAE